MNFDATAIGRTIYEIRKEKKYTQDVLSGLANINRSHLAMIETNSMVPEVETLWKLAQALDMPLHELMRRIETAMKG